MNEFFSMIHKFGIWYLDIGYLLIWIIAIPVSLIVKKYKDGFAAIISIYITVLTPGTIALIGKHLITESSGTQLLSLLNIINLWFHGVGFFIALFIVVLIGCVVGWYRGFFNGVVTVYVITFVIGTISVIYDLFTKHSSQIPVIY